MTPFGSSVLSCLTNNSDVFGIGEPPSRLVVNIHPASTHALELDCLAININHISINRRDGHFGGSAFGPPFNQ